MPSKLADDLYQHLLDRFPADRDYPRGALYVEGMPPLVASLLGRTLDRWLEHELDNLESRWFDFEDPGVRAARAELVVALGRTARVPRGAWAETLRYAVGAVVRHLVTPANAITDATFEGQPEALPPEVVRKRLHTFEAYPYLPEIADAYLAQKKPSSIDPETLHGLLLRIDRRVTADYGAEDWLRLLGPLFVLARRVPGAKGVHVSVLDELFVAKGQDTLAAAVRSHDREQIDEQALHKLLSEVVGARGEAASPESVGDEGDAEPDLAEAVAEEPLTHGDGSSAEALDDHDRGDDLPRDEDLEDDNPGDSEDDETEGEVVEPARGDIAERISGAPAVMPAPPDEPEPLWKRFAGGTVGPTVETAVPVEQSIENLPDEQEADADEPEEQEGPVWKRFFGGLRRQSERTDIFEPAEPAEPAAARPSLEQVEQDVLGGVQARQRRRYVRDLFGGNEDAYHETLARLAAAGSWSEASQIIANDIFRQHGVDIYSERAVAFTDAVNERFER